MKKGNQQNSDFPKGLSQPALRALDGAGYTRLEQLTEVTEAELMKLHGFGKKGLEMLRGALAERGLSFAEKPKK
jgi:DNA-directed RNA polymerase alpha subunit